MATQTYGISETWEADSLREILASSRKVDMLKVAADAAKAEAKLAREAWEDAVGEHMELCRSHQADLDVSSRPLIAECEARANP